MVLEVLEASIRFMSIKLICRLISLILFCLTICCIQMARHYENLPKRSDRIVLPGEIVEDEPNPLFDIMQNKNLFGTPECKLSGTFYKYAVIDGELYELGIEKNGITLIEVSIDYVVIETYKRSIRIEMSKN